MGALILILDTNCILNPIREKEIAPQMFNNLFIKNKHTSLEKNA